MSFAEYVRRLVARDLGGAQSAADPAVVFDLGASDGSNVAANKDAMLAEAFSVKRIAGDNPWGVGATTLEWTLPSPPPFHQFNELPHIH